jgi:hypothetical protein
MPTRQKMAPGTGAILVLHLVVMAMMAVAIAVHNDHLCVAAMPATFHPPLLTHNDSHARPHFAAAFPAHAVSVSIASYIDPDAAAAFLTTALAFFVPGLSTGGGCCRRGTCRSGRRRRSAGGLLLRKRRRNESDRRQRRQDISKFCHVASFKK